MLASGARPGIWNSTAVPHTCKAIAPGQNLCVPRPQSESKCSRGMNNITSYNPHTNSSLSLASFGTTPDCVDESSTISNTIRMPPCQPPAPKRKCPWHVPPHQHNTRLKGPRTPLEVPSNKPYHSHSVFGIKYVWVAFPIVPQYFLRVSKRARTGVTLQKSWLIHAWPPLRLPQGKEPSAHF